MSVRSAPKRCLPRPAQPPATTESEALHTTLADIRAAPELAVLDVIDHGLAASLLTLRALHPSLDHPTGPGEPPTLRRARDLARSLRALMATLAAYRAAVVHVIRPALPGDDDFPF